MLVGAFALTACSGESTSSDDEAGTTTSPDSSTDDSGSTTTDSSTDDTLDGTTTTDNDDSVDNDDSLSGSFYAGPDPDIMYTSTCDPFAQDCPDGEKCVPYSSVGGTWDANKCVPITGDGQPGDPCTSGGVVEATDDCDGSSVCWSVQNVEGQLVGVCTPFCDGTSDEPTCEPGFSCLISNEGSVTLCVPICDPLAQDCGDGLGCYWHQGSFQCVFTTQDIPAGEPCSFINDCAPGHVCVDAEQLPSCDGPSCCAAFCDLDEPVCAGEGTACGAFFGQSMAPRGLEDVGICTLP